jgi:hypothetical protein
MTNEDRLGRRDQLLHGVLERIVGELVGVAVEDVGLRAAGTRSPASATPQVLAVT